MRSQPTIIILSLPLNALRLPKKLNELELDLKSGATKSVGPTETEGEIDGNPEKARDQKPPHRDSAVNSSRSLSEQRPSEDIEERMSKA